MNVWVTQPASLPAEKPIGASPLPPATHHSQTVTHKLQK